MIGEKLESCLSLPIVLKTSTIQSEFKEFIEFIPDGVFSIKNEKISKTLLFFLETVIFRTLRNCISEKVCILYLPVKTGFLLSRKAFAAST